MHTRQRRRYSISGRPRRLEQIETDFAGLEIDIRVADFGDEFDGGRGEGVSVGDGDVEEPAAV